MSKPKYIKDFENEILNKPLKPSNYDEIIPQASKSKLILVSDFRSLKQSQIFIKKFISDLFKITKKIIVGTDVFFTFEQNILQNYLLGRISDEELLNLTGYKKNWGYPWENYKLIFQNIKDLNLQCYALDVLPRNQLRYMKKRDLNMGWKIARLLKNNPDFILLVFTGESRLSESHLPSIIQKELKQYDFIPLRIFQNPDMIYEKAISKANDFYRLDQNTFCVMNSTKGEKIKSFSMIKKSWEENPQEDERLDLQITIYNLIDRYLKFLNINPYKYPIKSTNTISPFLIDGYPLVLKTGELIKAHSEGSMFIPKENKLLIFSFDLVHGGEEITHYVNSALKGELYKPPQTRNNFDQFYTSTIEEALGYFGSKLFSFEREFKSISDIEKFDKKILHPLISQFNYKTNELNDAANFIKEHHRYEKSIEKYKSIPHIIKKYVTNESKITPLLFHDLGYRLGEKLYRDFKIKKISKRHIKKLFMEEFSEVGKSFETYLSLVI